MHFYPRTHLKVAGNGLVFSCRFSLVVSRILFLNLKRIINAD